MGVKGDILTNEDNVCTTENHSSWSDAVVGWINTILLKKDAGNKTLLLLIL